MVWVLGNNSVNYTSNGGLNWVVLDSSSSSRAGVSFLNQHTGWVCGASGMVKKTTNGGYNWITVSTGSIDDLKAISFFNSNYGIAAGDWGKIFSTTNGGSNWSMFTDPYMGFFTFVNYKDLQNAFVSGLGSNIYKTTNNGLNWSLVYVYANIISTIKWNSAGTGFAFGTPGDIFNTFNNGSSWNRLQPNGLNMQIFGASVSPGGTIWVAADSGMILNSTNSAQSWNPLIRDYITKSDLNSVFFTDNNTGFACGNNGVIIKTTNAGLNWTHTGLIISRHFKSVKFLNSNTGFVCGGDNGITGLIYKTTDSGSTWSLSNQDSASLNSIHFVNQSTGWAAGNFGYILKSTNTGNSWSRTRFQTATIFDINFIDSQTGFICTNGIYKTTNSGFNWYQVSTQRCNQIQFIGNNGYAVSSTGNTRFFSKSTNLGENWVNTQISNDSTSLYFANNETGWICSGSTIRKTTNGGVNWSIQQVPAPAIRVKSVFFRDSERGWVVGGYGGIMRTLTGGIGIELVSAEIPRNYSLGQNYPNPFNPATKIRFQIPAFVETTRRVVSLRIYDILGKEISTLINEELKPGTYEVEWNAASYSSGVYFYSLMTNNFTQTKKMVVLK
jgi:photosystem II stability/assembly factor-like uncharacterized protein